VINKKNKNWLIENKDDIDKILEIENKKLKKYASISVNDKNLKQLYDCLNEYENFVTPIYNDIKMKTKIKEKDQNFDMTENDYDNIIGIAVDTVVQVTKEPWFLELLKMIPFVGTITQVITSILGIINKKRKRIK